MQPENNIGYNIKIISKEFEKAKEKNLRKLNLTSQQINIILYLAKHEKVLINQKMLEKHFSLSNATISGILKRLEIKKYIYRSYIEDNKKEKYIFLDQAGIEIKNELYKGVRDMELKVLNGFLDDEKKLLIEYLKRIQNNLKEEEND